MKGRFLTAFYTLKAKKHAPTHLKGWMNDDRYVQWDESVKFETRISDKILLNAQVILDLDNEKVIKNWKKSEKDSTFQELFDYYNKHYQDHINQFNAITKKT